MVSRYGNKIIEDAQLNLNKAHIILQYYYILSKFGTTLEKTYTRKPFIVYLKLVLIVPPAFYLPNLLLIPITALSFSLKGQSVSMELT